MSTNLPATTSTNRGIATVEERPSFLQTDSKPLGVDQVRKKIQPPYMKVVQKSSDTNMLDEFGQGALVLVPDNIEILPPKATAGVRFIPVFMFVEFLKLNPLGLRGAEPMIAERTKDPNSEIARRAITKELWYEAHPRFPNDEKNRIRYAESLCFVCVFDEPGLPDTPFMLCFMKGQIGVGRKFCNLINMRRANIFDCVFELKVDPNIAKNAQGEWWKFMIENPPERAWVTEQQHVALMDLWKSMADANDAGDLEATYEDDEEELSKQATEEEEQY